MESQSLNLLFCLYVTTQRPDVMDHNHYNTRLNADIFCPFSFFTFDFDTVTFQACGQCVQTSVRDRTGTPVLLCGEKVLSLLLLLLLIHL